MKKLADSLTGSRFVLASLITWTASTSSPETGILALVLLTLLAWTSDVLDGPLARRAAVPRQTWLGAHDLEADLSLVLALVFSMAMWRGAPAVLLAGIILAGVLGRLVFHSLAPVKLGMGLVYGLFIIMVWRIKPVLGGTILAWIAVAALLNSSRARAQVTIFLSECRKITRDHAQGYPRKS